LNLTPHKPDSSFAGLKYSVAAVEAGRCGGADETAAPLTCFGSGIEPECTHASFIGKVRPRTICQ
jgi:hypothetical protein